MNPSLSLPGFFEEFSVSRNTAGSYVDGEWVDGTPESATITASVQPMGAKRAAAFMASGIDITDVVRLLSLDEVFADDVVTETKADEITIQGKVYRVESSDYRKGLDLSHWDVHARLVRR